MRPKIARVVALALLVYPALAAAVPIPLLATDAAGFVGQSERGPLDQPLLVTSYAEFADLFGTDAGGLANPFLAPSAAAFFANGGQRLWIVRTATADPLALIGTDGGQPGSRTGLQALLDVDEVAVVAIPGATSPTVQAALIVHAETAGDRLAILDPVTTDDVAVIQEQRAALNAAGGHAALYFPWVYAAPAGTPLLLPPSGLVAGVHARTDTPDSPVGILATATDVSYHVSGAEQDLLNPQGINTIRLFGTSDVRVWGARTLSSDPEWRYIAVRRVALCLEESIDEGTAWAVFEPNDETLWAQLRADVGDFLHQRWLEGWFQGASADDGYFVRCDASTMTQEDIEAGRTVILVGFAPLRPAEFVVLRIVHERPLVGVPSPLAAAGPVLHGAAPNPFNPRTVIGFDLPRPEAVSLRIYDPSGRLVRTLLDGAPLAAGRHDRDWDGRDAAGAAVASGVYLVRLGTPGSVRTARIALAR